MNSIELPAAVSRTIRPREDLTVSEWSDQHRQLDRYFTAEPGPWRTARAPWIREIQDSFADPAVSSIIFIKGSRVGGTESMNNMLAYSVDARPAPALFVLPRKPDVDDEFTGRIRKIFEGSTRLREHIPGGNWASEDQLTLDTMTIYGGAATTPGDLIRKTIGIAFFDEVDNCEAAAGRIGNVWALIEKRLTTFGYRAKLIGVSTPSTEDGTGWQTLQRSDWRKYFVPCPHCGAYQVLDFDRLAWPADERDPDRIELLGLVRYSCEACQHPIDESRKIWMVDRGVWVPKFQQILDRLEIANAEMCELAAIGYRPEGWRPRLSDPPEVVPRLRGYWLPSYYSTLGLTWSKIAADFLRVKDDRESYRVHINQIRALPWKEAVVVTEVGELRKKTIGALPEGVVPARAVKLIGAADVHLHYLVYGIWAFGPREESWLIRHGTCETYADFYDVAFDTEYRYEDDSGGLSCDRAAIDTRYRRDETLDFCSEHEPEIIPFMGVQDLPDRWQPRPAEWNSRGGRDTRSMLRYNVNVSYFKTKVHRLARLPAGHPSEWHLHRETSEEFFRQFTAEQLTWQHRKRAGATKSIQVWKPTREGLPTHYLDVSVYVLALADILNLRSIRPREVTDAERKAIAERLKQQTEKGMRMPDGRPYLVTRR